MTECEECQQGIHKHMDALNRPEYNELENFAHRMDAIDCKNLIHDGQGEIIGQCVCHLWREQYKKELYPEKVVKV